MVYPERQLAMYELPPPPPPGLAEAAIPPPVTITIVQSTL